MNVIRTVLVTVFAVAVLFVLIGYGVVLLDARSTSIQTLTVPNAPPAPAFNSTETTASTTTSTAPSTPASNGKPTKAQTPAAGGASTPKVPIEQQVTVYQHRVAAYSSEVTAYGKRTDAQAAAWKAQYIDAITNRISILKVVVDSLLTPLLTALIAYALVKGGATVVNNQIKARAAATFAAKAKVDPPAEPTFDSIDL
jgi:hypothetical protein